MNETADLADRRCIYCWGATGDAQFSEEHIWPQSLGGVAGPADFITRDVCETCNNRCGLWVDAGFTKTFLAFGDALRGAELFLDPDKPGPLPLVYMGIDVEFACAADEVCERWAGPSGEHVYHVHLRDQPKWDAHAGGDILRRRRDPGRVYVYLTSPELYWTLTALISVAARFPRAKRRCLTVLDGDSLSPLVLRVDEGELADCEVREIAFIRGRPTAFSPSSRWASGIRCWGRRCPEVPMPMTCAACCGRASVKRTQPIAYAAAPVFAARTILSWRGSSAWKAPGR